MFVITLQDIINHDLKIIDNYSDYRNALSALHSILNELNNDEFVRIRDNNSFYLNKRGYVYGASPTHIYRINEVENPKREFLRGKAGQPKQIKKNEENGKKNSLPKINIRH